MAPKADQNQPPHAQAPQSLTPETTASLTPDATASLTVDGCVCPQCYKSLKAPVVTEGDGDSRYGRRTRSYAGMCFECLQGCRVVQFERDGKWIINSYLLHRYESGAFVGYGGWVEVNPLPLPPAVLNGPGGDFDKAPDPDYDPAISAIHTISTILTVTTNAIGELLKTIEKLRKP